MKPLSTTKSLGQCWKEISSSETHTLAILNNGTLWAWGQNNQGQLGDGTTTATTLFHKVKLDDDGNYLEKVVQITAEDNTAHALTADGNVYSWG